MLVEPENREKGEVQRKANEGLEAGKICLDFKRRRNVWVEFSIGLCWPFSSPSRGLLK